MSFVSKANGMTGWMVRNIISRESNVVLKICKTVRRPHIEYCTRVWAPELRHVKLESNIESRKHIESGKNNKKKKEKENRIQL